jgi:small subunit ribosomal protein S16
VAVTLRFTRRGLKKRPFYRLVAADHENPRDGKFIELLGTYDPKPNPPVIALKEERVKYWLTVGAAYSDLARSVINRALPGIITKREEHHKSKILARRKARKARAAKSPKKATAKK